MYPNVWIGEKFNDAEKKVLILGESHYGNKDEIGKSPFATKDIVKGYLGEKSHRFFNAIAKTFGYERKNIKEFYDYICFGNYVDVVVDKDDKKRNGKAYIEANKNVYNKELFDFCIGNSIDIVVCFSKAVYWNLPFGYGEDQRKNQKENQKEDQREYQRENKKATIKIEKWMYKQGTLDLDKDLLVYGLPHPTGWPGYDAKLIYEEYMKNEFGWLCNR